MLAASRAWRNGPSLGYRLFLQLLLPHAHGELGRSRCRTDCGTVRNRASGPRCQRHRPRGNWQPLANLSASPGTHSPRAPGDGFAIVLTHADQPKILLMVRVHGVPGAQAAKTAGLMLRRIEGSFKE